jgi:sugar phosphate isomerase/epimerase
MKNKIKFSTGLITFGNQNDRFCGAGYKTERSIEEMFKDASEVEDLTGLELVGSQVKSREDIKLIKKLKDYYGFSIVGITVELFSESRWQNGSFSSNKLKIRKEAIEEVKNCMDVVKELDGDLVNIWPGQDGYDYIFQADYIKSWEYIIEGIRNCAEYRNDVRLSIEYKPKEPRTHCFIGTIGKTILLLNKINKKNVGITIDVGHALYAYENIAESVSLCKLHGKELFLIHLNDNYRYWDDDMMIGSVHIPEYIELIYWLIKTEYSGWYSLDIFPYRENGIRAAGESIKWLKRIIEAVEKMDKDEMDKIISDGDATISTKVLRNLFFKEK